MRFAIFFRWRNRIPVFRDSETELNQILREWRSVIEAPICVFLDFEYVAPFSNISDSKATEIKNWGQISDIFATAKIRGMGWIEWPGLSDLNNLQTTQPPIAPLRRFGGWTSDG